MIIECEALSEISYLVCLAVNKMLHKNKFSISLDNIPHKANSDSYPVAHPSDLTETGKELSCLFQPLAAI
jgi:hypothetical protein